jgi:hypothetical protein
LRDDQQFAVGVVEEAPLHRRVGGIQVDADAVLSRRRTVAGDGVEAIDEIDRSVRQWQWIPAQLVGGDRPRVEVVVEACLVEQRKRPMHRRRADPVQPAAAVFPARRGERSAAQLFRIQAMGHALRGVLALRQCPRDRLGGELVAEAGLVAVAGDRHRGGGLTARHA